MHHSMEFSEDSSIKTIYERYISQSHAAMIIVTKEKVHHNLFSDKFNLHPKQPYKDTNQTSESLQIKIQSSESEGIRIVQL